MLMIFAIKWILSKYGKIWYIWGSCLSQTHYGNLWLVKASSMYKIFGGAALLFLKVNMSLFGPTVRSWCTMASLCSGDQSGANSTAMIFQFSLERKQKPLSSQLKKIYILLRALRMSIWTLRTKCFVPWPFFLLLSLSSEFCQCQALGFYKLVMLPRAFLRANENEVTWKILLSNTSGEGRGATRSRHGRESKGLYLQ